MVTGTVIEAFVREVRSAREAARPIIQVRVTEDALPGSVVAAPITPERARTLGTLVALPNDTVDAVPTPGLELLVHPEDWAELMVEQDPSGRYVYSPPVDGVERVLGIPVER